MRVMLFPLALATVVPFAVGDANAALITPSSAVATSSWFSPISPDRLIDGSGLSGVGPLLTQTHDNDPAAFTMWHGGPNDAGLGGPVGNPPVVDDQRVVFVMPGPTDLSAAYVWNLSQNGAGASRSVNEFEIRVSTDTDINTAVFTSAGTYSLAPTAADGSDLAQTITLGSTYAGVNLVEFNINSAHSGLANEYVGLAEVRFEGEVVPEPAAAFIVASLLVGVMSRRS